MNPNIKNNKVSRSLQAILAGSDEEVKNEASVSEMVAEKEDNDEDVVEETKEETEEEPESSEDDSDDDDSEEVEEITEEEVESARKESEDEDEEEPVEIEDDDEEPVEISDDDSEDVESDDDEPIAEEDIEEITDDEVEAAREEQEDEEEPEEVIDDDEDVEEQPIEDAMDEENSAEEYEDEPDEDATTEAVASLVKSGFVCSLDGKGKICVTACGEPAEDCPECNPKKEDACVTLNPVSDDDKVEAEDVTCVQSGTEEKPFYTVLIKGMPTAAICLEDQPNAEAIRGYFLSADYPRKLASAMAKGGVKNVLDTQKARMFVAKAEQSELAQSMKAEAKADFDKQIAEAVTKMAEKFANSVKLAVAGMNKNFFTEDNDLKAAAYAAFTELGCNESVAYDKVNKVFAQADKYFDTVIAKAQELMGKSDEAFAEVSEMVANAGIASKPAKTFATAMAEGNNPVIAGVMQDQQKVESKAESKIRTMRMFR